MSQKSNSRIICEFFTWNLFQRGGVFYADGRINEPSLGKHSLGTRNRDEAVQMLRQLDRRAAIDMNRAKPSPENNHHEILLADGWQQYTQHVARPDVMGGAGTGTQKRYRAVRDKHEAYCKERGVATWNQLDKKHVNDYGAYLNRKGYSAATIYLECTLLKQIVKWLIEEEKALPESHRIRLHLRRSQESDTYCYSRDEVKAILEHCSGRLDLHWLEHVITALATSGMRIGELCGLRWSDVDLTAVVITLSDNRFSGRRKQIGAVQTNKGRRTRRVPIHPDFLNLLKTVAHRADGRVMGGPMGGILKPDTVRNIFKREVLEPLKEKFPTPKGEIGFEHGRLHSFRHYFVSEALLGGASDGEVRDWVGHRDSRIIERYRHQRSRAAQQKMETLNFLGGENEKVAV